MKTRELVNLGIPKGELMKRAIAAVAAAAENGITQKEIRTTLRSVVDDPRAYRDDRHFGELAGELQRLRAARDRYVERSEPARFKQWGEDLEPQSVQQMVNACRLPVSVRGALMPDAHLGYGLPIGGVLATRNAVIPYAVGVDIACRMKLTVLDLPLDRLETRLDRLAGAIESETRFGIGASFGHRRRHPVLDEDWSVTSVTAGLKDKAWAQLGTSGSGNHFVEFGKLVVQDAAVGVAPGEYLALMSHSGSRGAGATVAGHYSRMAKRLHPELPKELGNLSWLDLDTEAGRDYWEAMQLMGKYAAANHSCIHRHVAENLGAEVLLDIENHHNFAWKEVHDGEQMIVHRKGATPAGKEVLGIIPGSMASPAYIVRGKGNPDSLESAAHGAGRKMSRTQAKRTLSWAEAQKFIESRGVKLMSAGLDEVPMVYKDIDEVMAAQDDLVESLARFEPRLVKMAPAGERPED